MSSLPTVLIFTYAEYGQANVNLATSYELALAGANVYIASFPSLRPRISRLQELIDRHASRSSGKPPGTVIFRECKGITPPKEAVRKHGVNVASFPHPPGLSGALECYSKLDVIFFPWDQEEYLAAIENCKEIIAAIKPNVVLVDAIFRAAFDACELVGQKCMVMSPVGVKEVAVSVQPYLAAFWKYPVSVVRSIFDSSSSTNSHLVSLSSGFPFPLKWWQVPLNIYLYIRLIIHIMTSPKLKKIRALRGSLGFKSLFGPKHYSGVTCVCPALTEIDFPFAVIPENMLLCGPIVIPFDPLEESDPALMKWLDNGPTVMINLGSHVLSDEKLAREMAGAFRILLNYHDQQGSSNIQVLWKAKASGDNQKVINEIIGKEIKEGRVKVVAWLDAEPVSILQHPNVVCTVHHGGANSFYEGVW